MNASRSLAIMGLMLACLLVLPVSTSASPLQSAKSLSHYGASQPTTVVITNVNGLLGIPTETSRALVVKPASSGFLDLNPNQGPVGVEVAITGQVMNSLDQSCSISSPTNGAIITAAACVVNGGGNANGNFTGSFTVGNVLPGQYVIEVTACVGNSGCAPSSGDFAQAIFTVQGSANQCCMPGITVSPYGVIPGSTVQVFGQGFSLSDSTCSLSGDAVAAIVSCRISNGSLTGIFVVANVPTGYYELEATGNPTGDHANTNVGISQVGQSSTGIPGFPTEAILLGLLLGGVFVCLVRREDRTKHLE